MWYLTTTLIWWLLAALILGAIVGWYTCRQEPRKEGLGWLGIGLVAFVIGLFVCALRLLPGKMGLWFDTAMLFFAAYVIGCCIGCLFGRKAVAETVKPVAAVAAAAAVVAPRPAPVPAGPAAVRPYQWQAAKDASSVTLTGYVPSEDARGRVVASAKTTLAPAAVVDKLQLGSGAPAGLEGMASMAFGHLAKLDKGIASLIDTKYTLTGVAGTQPSYDSVMGGVKALAAGYSLAKVDIVAPPVPRVAPIVAPVVKAPVVKAQVVKAPAPKAAPAPVAVKAPEPKAAPKIAGEDKVPGKRPAGLAAPRGGKADDLKRIRGIGQQNEGRLHGLGIWHFDQISTWNSQESLWVGSYLAFPGRIEREEWIKQAKTLAAGKDTEFSKRVAKGQVATSKDDGTLGKKNVEAVKPMRAVKGTAPATAATPAKATKPKK
jgi:predicted flap endonuclease-1-like 5' DNA nuclease